MRFIILGALLITGLHAKPRKSARKPAQAAAIPIQVTVVYGDKTSRFTMTRNAAGARLDFSNSEGRNDSRQITATNFEYLTGKLVDVAGANNDRAFCLRSHILVNVGNRTRLGCLGAPNPLAKSLTEGVNALSYLF